MPRQPKAAPGAAPKKNVRDQLKSLGQVAAQFKSWRPAKEVLTTVRAQPTIFPQFDIATRVGGWPLQRFGLIHGPSNNGKTIFVHGLGLSFLRAGSFYAYVDAEYTTPEDWLRTLMAEHADHPGFVAQRPRSFEDTVDSVREFVEGIGKARDDGKLAPETSALIVIDSIRKLVPDKLMAKIAKDGASGAGVDGAGGRAAQMRAALNAQWLDELVPLLYHTGTTMLFIARETDDPDADFMSKKYGTDYKVGGGKALIFDSSLACRITRASWLKRGTGEDAVIVGERHRVRIHKTKVGGKDGKYTDAFFHTSNGVESPAGFDHARDVFDLALEYGLIEKAGAWYAFEGERMGNGEENAVAYLRKLPDKCDWLEEKVRAAAQDALVKGGTDVET
jgi:recombination protein RecA